MTARTARPRGRSVLWLMALGGCGKLLGIDATPVTSECVSDADCKSPLVCRNWQCVGVCTGGDCASGGNAGTGVEPGAGEGGMGPAGAGGTNGVAGEGTGGSAVGGGAGTAEAGGTGGRGDMSGGRGGAGNAGTSGAGTAGAEAGASGGVCSDVGKCLKCDEEGVLHNGPCQDACSESDGCVVPPSCNGLSAKCGSNLHCCLSIAVPGGDFERSSDGCSASAGPLPATVGPFSLDAFEVTVGRMHQFVDAYADFRPGPGDGKGARNKDDRGWESGWSAYLPESKEALVADLQDADCGTVRTFTEDRAENILMPVNCVSWYVAQAFCIWDGGRLPTEAEWDYVASGGEGRFYPWSVPADSELINHDLAVFGLPTGPLSNVGTHEGLGYWLHADLAGNVAEWVLDAHQACYPTPDSCPNCGESHSDDGYRVVRGGSFSDEADGVREAARSGAPATARRGGRGFRCARDL